MQNFVFMARMSRGLSDDTINLLFILSFIVAIAVYFIFLNPSNENKFSGFLKWLYNFLSFRFLFLELAFPHNVKAVLVRIGKQIIGFFMCQIKVVKYGLRVTFYSISQTTFDAIFYTVT